MRASYVDIDGKANLDSKFVQNCIEACLLCRKCHFRLKSTDSSTIRVRDVELTENERYIKRSRMTANIKRLEASYIDIFCFLWLLFHLYYKWYASYKTDMIYQNKIVNQDPLAWQFSSAPSYEVFLFWKFLYLGFKFKYLLFPVIQINHVMNLAWRKCSQF